jgi:phosphoserine aminotransferase
MVLEAEPIYPHCSTVISVVSIGGLTKGQLRAQRNAILLNAWIDKQTL